MKSDQPKPTTDLHNPSREEIYDEMTAHIKGDKPTGEWTADWLCEQDGMSALTQEQAKLIADAHNTEIAVRNQHIDNLDAALDAEQEEWIVANRDLAIEVLKLREQLASEREKVQTLVDALKQCKQGFIAWQDPQHANMIEDALAKVNQ